MTKNKRWIQKAIKKPGAYRAQLEELGAIKKGEKIPVTLSKKICEAGPGKTITWRNRKIKITQKLHDRACLHVTLSRMRKKRR